jgi:hypothetical protein
VQLAALVVLLTVALKFAPKASVPTLQLRICAAGYVPVIEQPAEAVVQVDAVPVGSVSLNITPVAEPGPALLTVILKLMLSPAFTVCPSGVFTMDRFGPWHVMLPGSETLSWLVAFAHALLL